MIATKTPPRLSALLCSLNAFCPGSSAQTSHDWPVYGGASENNRYSALKQINRENARQLKVAWTFDTGETGGLQTSPIVVAGVMYAYTPSQKVIAVDAATGKLLWKFDSGVGSLQPARGLVYWASGKEPAHSGGRDEFRLRLNAETGKPIATFGTAGRINLNEGLGREAESNYPSH